MDRGIQGLSAAERFRSGRSVFDCSIDSYRYSGLRPSADPPVRPSEGESDSCEVNDSGVQKKTPKKQDFIPHRTLKERHKTLNIKDQRSHDSVSSGCHTWNIWKGLERITLNLSQKLVFFFKNLFFFFIPVLECF